MLETNTNNYIEAWHNILKSSYLGSFRKQRTDILVHILLREILPDFRIKVARLTLGLERRRLNDSEKKQRRLCNEVSSERAATLVRRSVAEVGGAKYTEVIFVKSFTNDGQEYLVSLNQASAISSCSCKYMADSKSVCKHMYLAQSVFGYSISYDTRHRESADVSEILLPDPTEKQSTETEAPPKSDEHAKAIYLELVGFTTSLASDSTRFNDIEREAFNNINAQMTIIKRCRDSNDSSWSKRQRR